MNSLLKVIASGLLASFSIQSYASKNTEISGSIDVVSQYVSRGLTNAPENDAVALQASLTASLDQFYLFYWGSTLNYSFREIQTGESFTADKFEHDLGFGYNFNIADLNVDLWDAFYYYQGGKNTTANELGVTLTKPISEKSEFSLGVATFLYDVAYMNQWDTYLQLEYTHQINEKFTTIWTTGFSYFNDDGKYEGGTFLDTQTNFTFRFTSAQLNYLIHPNITGYGQFIIGGHNRSDIKQKNSLIIGLNYDF